MNVRFVLVNGEIKFAKGWPAGIRNKQQQHEQPALYEKDAAANESTTFVVEPEEGDTRERVQRIGSVSI